MNHTRIVIIAGTAMILFGSSAEAQTLSAELKAEGAAALAKAAVEQGSAVRGAILFPQQKPGCANCHSPGAENLLGPDLTKLGEETTNVDLVEALLEPSKKIRNGYESSTVTTVTGKVYSGRIVSRTADQLVLRDSSPDRRLIVLHPSDIDQIAANPKSTMPDGLVDQLADRQQFLDIVKYTMEIKTSGSSARAQAVPRSSGGGKISKYLQGLVLMDDFQCRVCHRVETAASLVPPKQAPELAWSAGRINPNYMERFIADPLHVKPGTTMPDVMGTRSADERQAAAKEITHFLVSLGESPFQQQRLDQKAAERGTELFHTVGCVACHSPRNEDGVELLSEDSVALGKVDQKYNLDGLVAFLEDPHVARPSGRMPNMQLTHWEAIDIAHYLLQRSDSSRATEKPFKWSRELAEKGRLRFGQLGCNRCHLKDQFRSEELAVPLTSSNTQPGCLSEEIGNWPRFDLSGEQRDTIRAAMTHGPTELTNEQQIGLTMTSLRCVVCHQRDALGGVAPERDEYFHTTNPNLGPQGRIPPLLSDVGAKLKPKWMRQVLVTGRTIRPYLKTRMPQYGADNVAHLVDLFQEVDKLPAVEIGDIIDVKETRNIGHEMAGTSGLNCIACHTFQQKRAATMPAVDLTEMSERLHSDWFYHYMRNPQRFNPNTIMPSFWPGGRAIRKDILDGDVDRQMQALWWYLQDGRQARTPRGLIRERIELLAGDEAVMLRRSYSGIGKRGIGVGYPNQVNLAFDAEQMRLAMIWTGKFADPGSVWGGQGSGNVRPLGSNLIPFDSGPELDDATAPWNPEEGRPPKHQFRGYFLDEAQRPTFMYRFDNIEVEDYSIDSKDETSGDVGIRRTLSFRSQQQRNDTAFRVASGEAIVTEDNRTFLVDDTLRIRIAGDHKAQVVGSPTGQQLRVPLNVGPKKSSLVLEYSWYTH